VGIINTLVGTGVMFLAYNLLKLNYWVSSASNYVVGSVVSYFLNKYFTFQNKERSLKQVLIFIANITVCYLIAYGVAKPLVYHILQQASVTLRDNCAMLAGMCLFVCLNYLGQRFVVFAKKA
jgi:putative flippase GtrA